MARENDCSGKKDGIHELPELLSGLKEAGRQLTAVFSFN